MVTEKQNVLNSAYIYFLDRPYNRISEMNRFSPATSPKGENIVMAEIPCLINSDEWKASKEELFNLCIDSLTADGFLAPGDVKRLLLARAPCAYPIYRKDYSSNLKYLVDYLNTQGGIHTLGRTGEFLYIDVDQCIERAFEFGDRLLNNMKN